MKRLSTDQINRLQELVQEKLKQETNDYALFQMALLDKALAGMLGEAQDEKVFLVIEVSRHGDEDARVFSTLEKRDSHVRGLLDEYEIEYGKKLNDVHDLHDVTFCEASINLYESEIE